MTIAISFDTAENCANFASQAKITVDNGATTMNIPWGKLALAKKNTHITNFTQTDTSTVVDFIVWSTASPSSLGVELTVVADLGNGFYHISTANGLALSSLVDSIDPVNVDSLAFHLPNEITLDTIGISSSAVDVNSAAAQWPRIRAGSTTRPLNSTLSYLDNLNVLQTPEVIVIDSGIDWAHQEFAGVTHEDLWKLSDAADFSDERGHGTMMASAIGGKNVGLARNVKLVNVKIATASRLANLLEVGQAIDAILARAAAAPSVTYIVNASWGTPVNAYLEHKFQQLLDAGITVVTAAGNDGADVADITPAGMAEVITVGAADKYDIPAGFNNIAPSDSGVTSNYGQRLDLFAPGVDVILAAAGTGNEYATVSGTSASAAYVAGSAAEIASLLTAPTSRSTLTGLILDSVTKDALLFEDGRFSTNQNKLLSLITANRLIDAYSKDLYLGAVFPDNPEILFNLDFYSASTPFVKLYGNVDLNSVSFTHTMEMDAGFEGYAPYVAFVGEIPDAFSSKQCRVTTPDTALLGGSKIKMPRFRIVSTSDMVTLRSPWLFFVHSDPANTVDEMHQEIETNWPGGGAVTLAICASYGFK